MIRRGWLTSLIREIHTDSRGTHGSCHVHAEFTKGRGIYVGSGFVGILMHNASIEGIPGPRKVKRVKGTPTSDDLVQRKFERSPLDEVWGTDITDHPTREGRVYCCCVLDTCSRRIVRWSIDSAQDTTLVVNALDMAITQPRIKKGSVVHADHGSQGEYTSVYYTDRIGELGVSASIGTVGDSNDNAMAESVMGIFKTKLHRNPAVLADNAGHWKGLDDLEIAICTWVSLFNQEPIHSELGDGIPC